MSIKNQSIIFLAALLGAGCSGTHNGRLSPEGAEMLNRYLDRATMRDMQIYDGVSWQLRRPYYRPHQHRGTEIWP